VSDFHESQCILTSLVSDCRWSNDSVQSTQTIQQADHLVSVSMASHTSTIVVW